MYVLKGQSRSEPVASSTSAAKGPVLSKKQAKKAAIKAAAGQQQAAPSSAPTVSQPSQASYGHMSPSYPGYAVVPPPYQQVQPQQPAYYQPPYQPYMQPMVQFPGAYGVSPNRFGPPASSGGMYGFPGGAGVSPPYAPPPPRPAVPEPKSDQPMVTIKRVMRSDSR
jgi:hypothetical protein